ncbi:MAG: hypothetical protein IJV22_04955 [Bacteroidales bacterium]|nr:hypothetical protein [Bacteroidales bacterium]
MRKSRTISLLLLCLIPTLLVGCWGGKGSHKLYNPREVNFAAIYNPNLDGVVYPSMVLALANYRGDAPIPLFSVSVTAPTNNTVLRVVVDSSNLNYVSILQEVLPKRGETYTFEPPIKWKYEHLYDLRQQGAVDLTFTCYINDEEVDIKNLRLNYRTVGECPLSILDTAGRMVDYRWLFTAYINEDHPYIDSILSAVLSQGIISAFSGYQRGASAVREQVFAVWNYALQRGIAYSSITCTTNPSRKANAQHIRFFDEVYLTRQANCIDACVFFASILRKIGIQTVILVEPCHAYLGYYTDKNRRQLSLLETTITGWVNLPRLTASVSKVTGLASDTELERIAKYTSATNISAYKSGRLSLEALERDVSRNLFNKAGAYDSERYLANRSLFDADTVNGYTRLVVDDLRKVVLPIRRY